MALVLTLKQGDIIHIGSDRLELKEVLGPARYTVAYRDQTYSVDAFRWTQLSEGCSVRSSPPRPTQGRSARIQIEAPTNQLITREESPVTQQKERNDETR